MWAPSTLPAKPGPLPSALPARSRGQDHGGPPYCWPARLSTPTHQLDALRKGVVHPVLLWEALQDLALAFPTP